MRGPAEPLEGLPRSHQEEGIGHTPARRFRGRSARHVSHGVLNRVDADDQAAGTLARRAQHEPAVTGAQVDDNVVVLANERVELVVGERKRLLSAADAQQAQNLSSAAAPPWPSSSSRACRITSSSADCCTDSSIIASVRSSRLHELRAIGGTALALEPEPAALQALHARDSPELLVQHQGLHAALVQRREHVLDAPHAALAQELERRPSRGRVPAPRSAGPPPPAPRPRSSAQRPPRYGRRAAPGGTGGASTRSPPRPRAGPPTIRRWNGCA